MAKCLPIRRSGFYGYLKRASSNKVRSLNNLDETVDFDIAGSGVERKGGHAAANETQLFSPVAKDDETLSEVTLNLEKSTRQLLQARLIMAAATTLAFFVTIKAVAITINGFQLTQFVSRLTAVVTLSVALYILRKKTDLSLPALRVFEWLIFAIPIAEILVVMWQECRNRLLAENVTEIPALFTTISFGVGILIAIYGMLIPSSWKRVLVATGIAAISPAIVALIQRQVLQIDAPDVSKYPGFMAPLMTMVMAGVATVAAHVVQTVRREAAEAKQYGQYQLLDIIGQGGMGCCLSGQASHAAASGGYQADPNRFRRKHEFRGQFRTRSSTFGCFKSLEYRTDL